MESSSTPAHPTAETGSVPAFSAAFHAMQELAAVSSHSAKKPRKNRSPRTYRCPDTIDWLDQMQPADQGFIAIRLATASLPSLVSR